LRIKDACKAAGRAFGLELRRFEPVSSHTAQMRAMLAHHAVNLVFDVGANCGQYAHELRRHVGYHGRIVSFEPMRKAHEQLRRAAAKDELWEVAERVAVGAQTGNITMNISQNSVSSSILPLLDAHARAAPESRYTTSEEAPLVTLDAVAPEYFRADSTAFLKIDTQGYESQVLQGALQTLARVVGLQLELSLVPLYAGQDLMPQLLERVRALDFDLWGIAPTFAERDTGRMLQVDAILFRRKR